MKHAIVLLLVSVLAWPVQPAPQTWKISDLQAPVYVRTEHPYLIVSGGVARFEDKKHRKILDIPAEQLQRVVYSRVSFNRAYQVAGDKSGRSGLWQPMSGGCTGSDVGCGGLVMMYLLTIMFASTMHGRSHFVRLTWVDRGVEQQLQFEEPKDGYTAINAALKDLACDKFVDLEAEGNKLQTELAKASSNSTTLRLEKISKLGAYTLPPGIYNVVPLDRGAGKVDLYIFASSEAPKIQMSEMRASTRATVSDSGFGDTVIYDGDSSTMLGIVSAGKEYRFASDAARNRGAN